MGMSEEHRNILINNRSYIVKNLKFSDVFSAVMREGNIITEEFEDEIKSKTTKGGKNAEFLDILARRGPYAFDQFIKALVESDQTEIIKRIDPDPKPHWSNSVIIEIITNAKALADLIDENYLKKEFPYKNRSHLESEYPRDADQKGRAVIINIKEFMNERSRKGSEKDVASLCRLFELMKYDVTTYGNMEGNANFFKKEEISIFLNKERQYMESNGFKYFVWFMVIMSHGEQDGFFTSEDNKILFKNVLHQFDGHNCKGLLFVPKVFIFQCCRGGAKSRGVNAEPTGKNYSPKSYDSDATVLQNSFSTLSVHEKADFFEAYSTPEGYASWRMTDLGSWFIRAIVFIFSRFSRHEDFHTMMLKVSEVVSGLKTAELHIQQPIFVNTLNRKLYLL